MNECYEHKIQWDSAAIECPLCAVEKLMCDLNTGSGKNTLYYGHEIAALVTEIIAKFAADDADMAIPIMARRLEG